MIKLARKTFTSVAVGVLFMSEYARYLKNKFKLTDILSLERELIGQVDMNLSGVREEGYRVWSVGPRDENNYFVDVKNSTSGTAKVITLNEVIYELQFEYWRKINYNDLFREFCEMEEARIAKYRNPLNNSGDILSSTEKILSTEEEA